MGAGKSHASCAKQQHRRMFPHRCSPQPREPSQALLRPSPAPKSPFHPPPSHGPVLRACLECVCEPIFERDEDGEKRVRELTLKTLGMGWVSLEAEPSAAMTVTVGRDIVDLRKFQSATESDGIDEAGASAAGGSIPGG